MTETTGRVKRRLGTVSGPFTRSLSLFYRAMGERCCRLRSNFDIVVERATLNDWRTTGRRITSPRSDLVTSGSRFESATARNGKYTSPGAPFQIRPDACDTQRLSTGFTATGTGHALNETVFGSGCTVTIRGTMDPLRDTKNTFRFARSIIGDCLFDSASGSYPAALCAGHATVCVRVCFLIQFPCLRR